MKEYNFQLFDSKYNKNKQFDSILVLNVVGCSKIPSYRSQIEIV